VKILAIDGGGIRGLIPALVLAEIETRTKQRIAAMVDFVAGTSTGGIIACALAKPQPMSARRIADIYLEDGPKIFDRSLIRKVVTAGGLIDERYDDKELMRSLRAHLGDTPMRDATVPLLITTYDTQARGLHFLRSEGENADATMVQATRATSAAPTYFEPLELGKASLVDGGVFAINPALCAYAEAGGQADLLLSLGTGSATRPLPYDEIKNWGELEWARPVLDVVFDGGQDAVDFQLSTLIDGDYFRLQTRLVEASDDLDDASEENLAALTREAQRLIDDNDARIDEICARLTA
jgi:predicted acylesterase/phospholipase RssA